MGEKDQKGKLVEERGGQSEEDGERTTEIRGGGEGRYLQMQERDTWQEGWEGDKERKGKRYWDPS